jgi:hypothetical protein
LSPIADNVAYTAGAGTSIATDDISSVHYQRVKLSLGADGKAKDLQPCSVGGIAGSTVDTTIVGTSAVLFGVSFWSTETTVPTGNAHFRDSTSSSTGTTLIGITWSTGVLQRESLNRTFWFGPQGINCASGIRIVSNSTVNLHAKAFYVTQ